MLSLVGHRAPAIHFAYRKLRVAGMAAALAASLVIGVSGTTLAWSPSSFSTADEHLLFSLTNQDRAAAGLPALVNDSYLHKEAEWRAKDMGVRDYFSHQIPPGNAMVFTYMQKDGYCFKVAGENIGLSNYADGVATASIETAFMHSTGHRENILGTWSRLGVGAYKAANGNITYAVLFSIPCAKAAPKPAPKATTKPAPKPTAVPTVAPTATPIPSPTDLPTAPPSPDSTTSATTTGSDGQAGATTPLSGDVTSLRVHEKVASQGPVDSLFHSLFGGLFGW